MSHSNVLIIGAGIAGAVAARSLSNAGLKVTVLDKGRGAGGRCTTRRKDELTFDHGAQYFTARGDAFKNAIAKWEQAGVVKRWDARLVEWKDGELRPMSDHARWVSVPGMSQLARHLLEGIDVRYEQQVERINHEQNRWTIQTAGGQSPGGFAKLLLTVPSVQCQTLLSDAAPDLAQRAGEAEMLPCWAGMLAFDEPIELPFDGAKLGDDSPISWLARDSSKPGRPASPPETWVLHASPEWSQANLECDRDEVGALLLQGFDDICKSHDVEAASPSVVRSHRWRYAQASKTLETPTLEDETRGLYIAGDWLMAGKVEGAFQSGTAAADRILKDCKS